MLSQPSLLVFAAMVAGILGAQWLAPTAALCMACAGLGLLVLGIAMHHGRGIALAALALLVAVGAWAAQQVPYPPPLPDACAPAGGLWQIRVDAPIDRLTSRAEPQLQTTVQLLAERCGGVWVPRTGRTRLRLRLHAGAPALARGDVLAVRLRLHAPAPRHHEFEPWPRERLRRQGVTCQAQALSHPMLLAPGTGMLAGIDRLRARGAVAFEAGLPAAHAALAKALTLGDTGALTPAQRDAWAAAGIAHLLSVSGLHVAMVALLASLLVRHVLGLLPGAGDRYSLRTLSAWCALPWVIGFCVLTGAHPAALRATLMAAFALVGLALGYPSLVANTWGVAGSAMLLADPMALYDVGFVLSFAAVGALVWLVAPVPLSNERPVADNDAFIQRTWRKARHSLSASWRVSLAATCVTAPITAYVFNRVAWVAPFVNMVAVPIGSTIATPLALLAAAWAPRDGLWQRLWMQPLSWVLALLDGMAHGVGDTDWASIDVPTPGACEMLACAAALGAACAWRTRRFWAVAVMSLAVVTLAGSITLRAMARRGDGNLWVRHLYVGQGDATLITLPRGGTVLIDGGGSVLADGSDPGRVAVAPTLRRLNVRSIDWMVLTHPHPDHINGLLHIAALWPVKHLLLGGGGIDFGTVQQLQHLVRKRGGTVVRLRDMPTHTTWEGVAVALLHPRAGVDDVHARWHLNDNSVVLRMQWHARSMLLVGDIEKRAEALLASQGVQADILKVGHHGSRTSSTLPFLQALGAHTAVISCGHRNHFGFPHIETLERLSITQTRMLRTDTEGTLTLRTDGARWFGRSVQHPDEVALDETKRD